MALNIQVIISALDRFSGPLTGMRGQLHGLEKSLGAAEQAAAQFETKWGRVMNLSRNVGAGMTIAAGGMGLVGKSAVDAAIQVEGYQAKLEVALKSSEKAKEMMGWATDFSAKTPFEMSEVVDATARLEMYGLSAKKWMPMVGDMAGAMGKDVTQAVEAVADAVSGGGMERLKEFGVSSAKLKAAGWSGGYQTAQDIESLKTALESIMGRDFGGGMEKMMNTAKGAMSNFSDAVFQLRLALGQALLPTVKSVTKVFTVFAGLIAKAAKDHPTLTSAVAKLGLAMTVLFGILGPILMILPGAISAWNMLTAAQLRNAAAAAEAGAANAGAGAGAAAGGAGANAGALGRLGGIAKVAGGFILRILAPVGAVLASAWGVVAPVLATAGTAIAGVGAAIAALPLGTIAIVIAALAALGLGIWQLVKHWDAVKVFFANIGAAIATFARGMVKAVGEAFTDLPRKIGAAVGMTVAVIMWIPTGVRLAAKAIGEELANIGKSIASLTVQAAKWLASLPGLAYAAGAGLVRGLGEWFTSLPSRIAAWFQGVWDYISGLPAEFYNAGVAMVQAIIDGLASKWNDLTAGFRDGLQKISDMLPHSEPKTGPLRGITKSGATLGEMFMAGLRGSMTGFADMLTVPTPQAGVAATLAGALVGAGGLVLSGNIYVDARGANDPAAVEAAGYRGAMKAISEVGKSGQHDYRYRD